MYFIGFFAIKFVLSSWNFFSKTTLELMCLSLIMIIRDNVQNNDFSLLKSIFAAKKERLYVVCEQATVSAHVFCALANRRRLGFFDLTYFWSKPPVNPRTRPSCFVLEFKISESFLTMLTSTISVSKTRWQQIMVHANEIVVSNQFPFVLLLLLSVNILSSFMEPVEYFVIYRILGLESWNASCKHWCTSQVLQPNNAHSQRAWAKLWRLWRRSSMNWNDSSSTGLIFRHIGVLCHQHLNTLILQLMLNMKSVKYLMKKNRQWRLKTHWIIILHESTGFNDFEYKKDSMDICFGT